MALALKYQTGSEFATRFWLRAQRAYIDGDKFVYHFMVWWIWDRIQAGDFTSDQARITYNNALGKSLNTAQWNTFVNNTLVPIKDRYLACMNVLGL
jgi:hypothetical protein